MESVAYSFFAKFLGVILLVCSTVLAINLLQGEPASVIVWLTHQALHIEVDLHGFFDKILTSVLIIVITYCAIRALFYHRKPKANYQVND
ncbi:hypothetical protein [Thalassotalea sp. PP2-459]|uniref:hypothetical protein n=1 Tax=Thalassotalea sp. PP2-459 TaxID=1742724 RepID=UPI000943BE02|nr:hypothetical protein [Thalassotalea sp. PP2-459]OKY25715.1 hypothetical protein BI291_14995 [Thalassotalea sp. PP2-459]